MWLKAKSKKYQGVFEVKSRVKTLQVLGIWSQQFEHKIKTYTPFQIAYFG